MFTLGQNIAIVLAETYPSSPTPKLIPTSNFTPTAIDGSGAPFQLAQTTLVKDLVVGAGAPAEFTIPAGDVVYVIPSPSAAETITLAYGSVMDLEGKAGTVPDDSVVYEAAPPVDGTVSSFLTPIV